MRFYLYIMFSLFSQIKPNKAVHVWLWDKKTYSHSKVFHEKTIRAYFFVKPQSPRVCENRQRASHSL